jgi:glycosyltransferase involved in cell wall biosynthesis
VLAEPDLRIEVLRNGVDLELFSEQDRERIRRDLNLSGPTLISVGNLIPLKGHDLVIEALTLLPGVRLLVCGEGSMRAQLERTARRCLVADRVRFLGQIKHEDLNRYYSAADVLVLASSREGWPNVLLEAMACGTPVVATAVGGIPEFVHDPRAGRIVLDRTAPAIAYAVSTLLNNLPARRDVREYATQFGWEDTTRRLLELFSDLVAIHSKGVCGLHKGDRKGSD